MRTKFLLSFLFIFFYCNTNIYSQWLPVGGPYGGLVKCIAIKENNIFIGLEFGGVYLSTDNGVNWVPKNQGLTESGISSLLVKNSDIFASTVKGIFVSRDNGSNWTKCENLNVLNCQLLAASDNGVYVVSNHSIYVSIDNGESWTLMLNLTNKFISSVIIENNILYCGTNDGKLIYTTDNGSNWLEFNIASENTIINSLTISEGIIYAGTTDGVYCSTNWGSNWEILNTGLPSYANVKKILIFGTNIFAGIVGYGIYKKSVSDINWTYTNFGRPTIFNVFALEKMDSIIFAGTDGGGVYSSSDNGLSWKQSNNGIMGTIVNSILINGTNFLISTSGSGLYNSTNNGANWINKSLAQNNIDVDPLFLKGTTMFAVLVVIYINLQISENHGKIQI